MLSATVRLLPVVLAIVMLVYLLTPSLSPFRADGGGYHDWFVWHPALMCVAVVLVFSQGMVAYITSYGPKLNKQFPDRSSRRALHGVVQLVGLGVALSGLMVVIADHAVHGKSNWGKAHKQSLAAHAWMGYLSLLLIVLQAGIGLMKLVLKTREQRTVYKFHGTLGLLTYLLMTVTMLVGFVSVAKHKSWSAAVSALAALLLVLVVSFVLVGPSINPHYS